MQYQIFNRPRIPRNRYGYDDMYEINSNSSSSLFGSSAAAAQVGADMSSLSEFFGATSNTDGMKGLVPAPLKGQQNYFIKGDGAWTDIPAYRWMSEFPNDEGLEKSGLQVDGDLRVVENLYTKNLSVEGQAHFWELVIDKAKMQGGQIFVSPSLFQIDYIGDIVTYPINDTTECFKWIHQERPDIWQFVQIYNLNNCRCQRLWMNNDDKRDHTQNECQIGDMMRCRTFNIDGQYTVTELYKDVVNTDYWTFVVNTGDGEYTDDDGIVHSGFYIDLCLAITAPKTRSRSAINVNYVNLNTYFELGAEPETSEMDLTYAQINELKKYTFETLCGSQEVDDEFPENQDDIDRITDYDFRIRGVGYIISRIFGLEDEYEDDTISSTFSLIEYIIITDTILYGDEDIQATDLINSIYGQEAYDHLSPNQNTAANRAAMRVLGTGEDEPEYSGDEPEVDLFQGTYFPDERNHWLFGYGTFTPRVGQQLGCLGHMWDKSRQNAIVISAIQPVDPDLVAPSIAQYTGIDTFGSSISNFRMNVFAKNGNVLTGKFMIKSGESYIKVEDAIEMFVNDIESGLEVVGIHLDGENSTIKMVGSVELHQNGVDGPDTLSVWDSNEQMRVQITPENIPSMNDMSQTTEKIYNSRTSSYSHYVSGESNVEKNHYTSGALWWKEDHYQYRVGYNDSPYMWTFTHILNIGYYKKGTTIDVTNALLKINLGQANFRREGTYYVDVYGKENGICHCVISIQRNGVSAYVVQKVVDYNIPANAYDLTISLGDILDDYDIPEQFTDTASYTLYVTATVPLLSKWTNSSGNNYNNDDRKFWINPKASMQCNVRAITEGSQFMQIGSNGLVYSVGNGDFFYSGESGIGINYKNNGLMLNNNGLQLYRQPQTIRYESRNKTVSTEFAICEVSGSSYSVNVSSNYKVGQTVTIIGYKGLVVVSPSVRNFKIYRYDVNNWSLVEEIHFSDNVSFNPATSSTASYLNIYKTYIQFIVGPDALYITSPLST